MSQRESSLSRRALLQMAVPLSGLTLLNPGKVLPPTKEFEADSLIVVWDIVLDRG